MDQLSPEQRLVSIEQGDAGNCAKESHPASEHANVRDQRNIRRNFKKDCSPTATLPLV
jgi:hypothetical protein